MSAIRESVNPCITGAILSEGQLICFDATDYNLEPGAHAVVIGALGRIHVAIIGHDHPTEMERKAANRGAIIPYISGRYPPETKENLYVKVLGRFIQQEAAQRPDTKAAKKRPALA